jgi:dTDP-4-dehydrorhamnose reductase
MKKILVTGSAGQLGSEIRALSSDLRDKDFVFTDYKEMDITDVSLVGSFISSQRFDAIINCAAYTAVDKAESDKERAYLINETGAKNLAEAAARSGCKFIHISTDFIFDGTHSIPISEDAKPNPLSIYGASKLAGEIAAMHANSDSIIFRTSWVYSSFGSNFVKTIMRLCSEREKVSVIYDQIGTPTYARDLAQFILNGLDTIVDKKVSGIYNYSNEGVASWYDFAIAIRDMADLKALISPIETSQYPTPAARPKYSILNKKKVKDTFNIEIPYWRDSLLRCIRLITTK